LSIPAAERAAIRDTLRVPFAKEQRMSEAALRIGKLGRRVFVVAAGAALCAATFAETTPSPSPSPSASPAATATPAPEPTPSAAEQITNDAKAIESMIKSDAARRYLASTVELPEMPARVIYRDKERTKAFSAEAYAKLTPEEQAGLEKRETNAVFYYETGYGTPVIYARPLDLLAEKGFNDFNGKRVLDFGYGAVGNLRLLALSGADAVGVDVEPVLPALYDRPEDQGPVKAQDGRQGRITMVHGQFPYDPAVRKAVGEGYDLFISKNTLKRGYIHPERPAPDKYLVHLGVDDESFAQAMFAVLKPGGYAMIYNLCPAQAPADKPYIPWADGRCPFERTLLEQVGFEVLEFDKDDTAAALDWFVALGYDQGKGRADLAKDLFAHYTLLRRPAR
jgi:hypothetical protein